jgi:DNA adenine methylase
VTTDLKTTALAQWYGSNRMLAHEVGRELKGCSWVGIPFAGGMCELVHIGARSMVVNDLHRHIINLASVCADRELGPELYRRLRRIVFHPDSLSEAQMRCAECETAFAPGIFPSDGVDRLNWAVDYFVATWMGRGGTAGTPAEFTCALSARWNANGGDSAVRYRSAIAGLPVWRKLLARCTFHSMDALKFIGSIQDAAGHGIYCDPPFPGPGDKYHHKFSADKHRQLAAVLSAYRQTRVVCRFYDDEIVRELYPESRWTWRRLIGGKTRTNEAAPEVLLINGASYAEAT